ncbi:hypothetical protein [Leuconostoc falkenbergense]|uniref:hypothetical protein n=1 Tax=Leuconostoc falkenbergense TaxID=2766470 RepID=UPI001663FD8D|nr:hypothetical protein [Leuconostoc falkenbergense]
MKKYTKEATQVNERFIQETKRLSVERHKRAHIQIKSELVDNKNINYRKYMKWIS